MNAKQEPNDPRNISQHAYLGYAVAPAFEWLLFGEVKPEGWIREQMLRDLDFGFAGSLNSLCHEASSDIFATGRNTDLAQNIANERGVNWWNGETEGNWRAGQIMLSHLSGHRRSISEAQEFVKHILASQDPSGYLGIFSPELRFKYQGELWTQACLLRGLLAYSESTGDKSVLGAVQRAVDLVIKTYVIQGQPLAFGETHDWMICDVLENLDYLTGDPKYREFALWLYETWNENEPHADGTVSLLLDLEKGFVGHGVRTYENLRVPMWLAITSGREDLAQASRNALKKIQRYTEPSGSAVSQEWIQDKSPDPSITEYEYCATKELQVTFTSALQKLGDASFADRVEHLWFNAAQGARLPDGSAVSYLTSDNRFQCNCRTIEGDELQKRNKYSPTHSDVAVCCNPNATQVAALYVRGMWMRPRQGGLAALLYGPSTLRTSVSGVSVLIRERTSYPFENRVDFEVFPESPVAFPLVLRVPAWSLGSQVVSAGAVITRVGQYVRVLKTWKAGDRVQLTLEPQVETVNACNGEIGFRYGPLLFALPLAAKKETLRSYTVSGFEDAVYNPAELIRRLALQSKHSSSRFGFEPEVSQISTAFAVEESPLVLKGEMVELESRSPVEVRLVPLGCAPLLRQVTFPTVS